MLRGLHVLKSWVGVAVLVAAAFCVQRAATAQEFCRCDDAEFTWRGCSDAAHCDAAGWAGCTPSPDDTFLIRAGCSVEVDPGDDVLLAQGIDRRVEIQAGGSLTLRGPVEWRVGPGGLRALPGSQISLAGCFRRFGGEGDECSSTLGPDSLFPVGYVIPCRDGDCSDDAELVRLAYPDGTLGMNQSGLLSRIDPVRDVLCFWQETESGYIGADSGYCYKIVAAGNVPGNGHLDFDIRQVWRAQSDQSGYRLERRDVQQGTLSEDLEVGARAIRVRETDVVQGRTDQMGRWIRCGGDQRAYLIASVVDDVNGDVLVLADDRGIMQSYTQDTRCHVDWGWSAGDRAFVMAPVHLSSSTNTVNETYARLQGDVSLSAVVVDGLGGDGSAGRGALQIRDGRLNRFEHVWVTDPLVRNREAVQLGNLPCGTSVTHLTVTGGPPDPIADQNYGLFWSGGPACSYALSHFYPRFAGDDNFVLESTGADPTGRVELQYVHAGPSSAPGDSGQFFDFGPPNPTSVSVQNALCTACTSQDGFGALVDPSGNDGLLEDVLWVGVFNGGVVGSSTGGSNPAFRFRNLGVVGSAVDAENALGRGPLVGIDTDRFYVRDVGDPRPDSIQLCAGGSLAFSTNLSRGIFANVTLGGLPCRASRGLKLSDVYFLNAERIGSAGPILQVEPEATDVRLQRLTIGFSRPPQGVSYGVLVSPGAAPFLSLDGLLLTGFDGPGVVSALGTGTPASAAAITWGAPTWFFGNASDDNEAAIAVYAIPPVRSVDPQFVDPDTLRFDLAADSAARLAGSGAGAAGFEASNWSHRKAKLSPMYMEPRPADCGLLGIEVLLPALLLLRRRRQRALSAQDPA